MTTSIQDLRGKAARQKDGLAVMYGDIDFGCRPERFTDDPDAESHLRGEMIAQRPRLLANSRQVATIEAFTMLGDAVADAYAALLPDFGFQPLVDMLAEACDKGVESVAGAPPELIAMIRNMERVPEWIDMTLVADGAAYLEPDHYALSDVVHPGSPLCHPISGLVLRIADEPGTLGVHT